MSLFSEFPPITKNEWLAKIEKDLKGKAIERLNWEISENWTVSPIAHSSDLTEKETAIYKKGKTDNNWEIGEVVVVEDAETANREALNALEGGVNALLFELPAEFTTNDFNTLLKDIQLEWISTHFRAREKRFFSTFLDFLKNNNIDTGKIKGSWRTESVQLEKQTNIPQFKLLFIDGIIHYKGTAQTIEELTHILRQTNILLKKIEAPQANSLQISLTIGESYFINIAKIRAFKILWHNLMKAYQLDTPLHLEAHLDTNSLTDDPHQNMIQMSTQALSAIVGGVDRLFLTPAADSTTTFTKRIARNVQHLFKLESHLDHVIDPSAGSYYIEKLTNEMVERSWEKFVAS